MTIGGTRISSVIWYSTIDLSVSSMVNCGRRMTSSFWWMGLLQKRMRPVTVYRQSGNSGFVN